MVPVVIGCILAALFMAPTAAAWELPEFMIFAGWPDLSVNGKIETLAKADFNMVNGPAEKLGLCRKYGLKLMISDPSLEMASRLSNDPTVWGYFIVDEPPDPDSFPALAEKVKAFHQADPNHPAYINLHSRGGDYVRSFIDIVQPEVLSYDMYQWWYGVYYKWWFLGDADNVAYYVKNPPQYGYTSHFVKLEQHRADALAAGIPLITWIEVTANQSLERYAGSSPYNIGSVVESLRDVPTPPYNAQKIRQSVYTSLAYGVKGIEWFISSMIFKAQSTELNQCGRDVAAINAELKQLGPILVKLQSVNVVHTHPVPRGSREASPDHWVQALGDGLVLGTFRDKKKDDFLIVANRNWQNERKAVLHFRRPVKVVEKFDKKTGEWMALKVQTVHKFRGLTDELPPIEKMTSVLGLPKKELRAQIGFYYGIGYPPPYYMVELVLAPGDGELLKVETVKTYTTGGR